MMTLYRIASAWASPTGRIPYWGVACLLLLAVLAPAARGAVPGKVSYQGLLLDELGSPVTGSRDFELRLFDVETAGAPLWTESHPGVSVLDGIYDLSFGSINAIPPAVLEGGTLYLEVVIAAEVLSPRQRLLAVPYAMRAAVAEETENIAGIQSAYFEAILVGTSWDGAAPDNFDPSEGLADVDADGVPNFMDADNDGDGLTDAVEVTAGTDINLVTPTLSSVSPPTLPENTPALLVLEGSNFEPSMTVQVGAETGGLANVTDTTAEVSIAGQAPGPRDVTVTLTNAQNVILQDAILFGTARRIFVTSTTHDGELGGLAGADAVCGTRALAAALTGTYQAWISDGVDSPATRSSRFGFPYIATNGEILAEDWDALVDGDLSGPGIRFDENGADVGSSQRAWTSVAALGAEPAGGGHCSGWTSTAGNGATGITGVNTSSWTSASSVLCSSSQRLYCIEQ